MSKFIHIDEVVESISNTHKFDKPTLKFLNTSDIHAGKILYINELPICELKGQAKKTIQKGDILFSEIRPKNKRYAYIDIEDTNDFVVSTKLMVLRKFNNDVDNKYFYYYITNQSFLEILQKRAENRIGSFPQITFDLLSEYKIRIPPIETQKRIADVLSSIDDRIDLNISINRELDCFIYSIYKFWFLQFDFPNNIGKPYKDSGMPMISEKGFEIPEHWTVGKLASLIAESKGGDWGKDEASGNYTYKVSCVRGADINYINGEDGESELPNRYILAKNNLKVLDAGDIVVEISGGSPTQSTGRATLITDKTSKRFENPLICSNFCQAITLKDKRYSYYFYYLWRTLYDNGIFFNYEGKTSGLKNLLFDMFVEHTDWYIPDIATVEKFNEISSAIHNQKETLLRQNKELAEFRNWLLPLLMNGQVTINDQVEADNCAEALQAPRTIPVDAHILGGHIVNKLHNTTGMGRTKLQKALHLVEYHCELSLNSQSMQFAAGPHDQELMNHIDQKFRNYGHVKKEKKVVNGRPQYKYTPTPKIVEVEQAYERLNAEKREKIDNLLDKLAKMDLGGAEVLSTLYAVWNNRLIRQEPITEELLVADFYAWSDHKSDFPESRVRNCLDYMRKEDIIPTGWGRYIDKILRV